MDKLILSYQSILNKYKLELLLLTISLIVGVISIYLSISKPSLPDKDTSILKLNVTQATASAGMIVIDVEGAVKTPDVYMLPLGSRIKDVIKAAGGLSGNADLDYFSKQFNLAQKLADEEKLYIPKTGEITGESNTSNNQISSQNESSMEKININTASKDQLDGLPGIGSVTADKIIQGRPYVSPDQLITSSIVNKSTYEKIKDLISII